MNEIEKLYRNAHVYPRVYRDITKETFENKAFNMADMCNEAFTAKKQLEFIKWLGIRDEFNFYQNKVTKDWVFYDHEKDATHYNFEQGLASRVNYIWQDLTAEERKQIKNILESEVRE